MFSDAMVAAVLCCAPQLQMTAMTRGIYISQKTARQLGVPNNWPHPDLWFEKRDLTTGKLTSNGLVGLAGGLSGLVVCQWLVDVGLGLLHHPCISSIIFLCNASAPIELHACTCGYSPKESSSSSKY